MADNSDTLPVEFDVHGLATEIVRTYEGLERVAGTPLRPVFAARLAGLCEAYLILTQPSVFASPEARRAFAEDPHPRMDAVVAEVGVIADLPRYTAVI